MKKHFTVLENLAEKLSAQKVDVKKSFLRGRVASPGTGHMVGRHILAASAESLWKYKNAQYTVPEMYT